MKGIILTIIFIISWILVSVYNNIATHFLFLFCWIFIFILVVRFIYQYIKHKKTHMKGGKL